MEGLMATEDAVYVLAQELLKVAPQCTEDLAAAKLRQIAYALMEITRRDYTTTGLEQCSATRH